MILTYDRKVPRGCIEHGVSVHYICLQIKARLYTQITSMRCGFYDKEQLRRIQYDVSFILYEDTDFILLLLKLGILFLIPAD